MNTRTELWDAAAAALARLDDDQARTSRVRVLVFAPFDRAIALGLLGLMGVTLAVFATPTPVHVAGIVLAAVALPGAIRYLVGDLTTPRDQRGLEVTVTRLRGLAVTAIRLRDRAEQSPGLPPRPTTQHTAARRQPVATPEEVRT